MEDAEHSHYVAQLKAEFDSCDTTTTGFLDRDELTALCRKLQLDAHLPLLLDTLLGERTYGRVNFEEFKNGFVAVLSRSLDFSTSEDDSSYLQPVIPDEVKLNRRRHSHADVSCHSPPSTTDSSLVDVHKAELRRSTSLESVESLKSDEEAGSQKDRVQPDFQSKAAQQEEEEGKQGVIREGDHVVLQQLSTEEMDLLLRKLDTDLDDKVSISNFQKVLCDSAPNSCSTPVRPTDVPRTPHRPVQEERSARHTLPSLLTATVGQTVLSQLDDGSGCTSPEQVAALWTEEGIRNSWDILQILDFPLEERLSLADLTLALDNELLVSGNGIHQAALISYKNEIHHLQLVAEQACRERDKLKVDLDLADQRNLQLVREVDDRHASMETLNQTRIRDLEQDFRERLTVLRSQTEQESEVLLQQAEREHSTLQAELQLLHTQEAELQEELCSATQENWRLEAELTSLRLQLRDAQSSVGRLKRELEELHHKFGSLEADGTTLSHEERFTEIVKEYELQCRELRDRNDELSSELELLKSQRSDRKFRQPGGGTADTELSWTEHESDCDDLDMKRSSSPLVKKKLQPADKTALGSLDSGPAISIQTELALEQLKQKHEEELQQLRIQLETQVNYYERSLELMRQSMEVERKDISQAFKLEISELEEQKAQAEQQVQQLKEMLDKLQSQIQHGGGGWSSEQERKVQRERAELEQNFAREIGNLVQRLSAEKDQLEAELKLKMDKEVMLVREECEQQLCQMKLQHAEVQHRLLHQLHLEHQRLQEQRGFWKKRLVQLEQEKLQREEVFHQLKEQLSQSESSVEELRRRCGQLEDDLSASGGRCCGLEARLEEACAQLEESIAFLESHEVLSKRLAAEKKAAEEELQEAQAREEQLLVQVTQLRQELGNVQAASDNVPQDCLTARDQTISALRSELETLSDTTRASAAELDSLKTDRARLIQDLKDQAMAVDKLQLQLDGLSDELDCRRSAEDGLQEALQQEKIRTSQLQSSLGEEQEEVCRLSQENRSYARLADQLSTQIVEMEDEISTLRDHLRDLSSQLNDTADLVLDLREQINSKTSEVDQLRTEVAGHTELLRQAESPSEKHCSDIQSMSVQLDEKDTQLDRVRQQVRQLQWDLQKSQNQLRSTEQDLQDAQNQMRTTEQDLQEAQNQMRTTERDFEEEKRKMKQQLMELEKLVLALEDVMDPNGPHRTQLEEVQSEKDALQERLSVLQQEVHTLEDNLAKKRRRLEETERDHEKSREEEERLHRENTKHREDILELSSRNLQLSSNNAELSASLCQEQESVRMLREHLATVSKQQEEEGAMVRQLQATALQQEREKLQQQVSWTQERQLMEAELGSCRDQLGRLSELEAKLSSTNLKLQWLEEDKVKLQREANERNHKVETLQQSLLAVESETELLRSQLHTSTREKHSHAQEVTDLKRKLQDAHSKVVELESCVRQLMRQKEELSRTLEEQEEQTSIMQNEETHRLRVQNQELQHKLAELELQGLEVQNLRGRLNEQEAARTQAEDQAARANATLSLVQVQHVRQLQELQEQVGSGNREQLLQEQVMEEQKRSQQLKEALRLQAEQSSSQITVRQEQYEKAVASLQQKVEELETKLKGARLVLQEKVQQLKEQLVKNATSSALLKDLYVENSQLMKALQVTEQRQKNAEKKNCLLDEKIGALNRLLREIVPMSLAT